MRTLAQQGGGIQPNVPWQAPACAQTSQQKHSLWTTGWPGWKDRLPTGDDVTASTGVQTAPRAPAPYVTPRFYLYTSRLGRVCILAVGR